MDDPVGFIAASRCRVYLYDAHTQSGVGRLPKEKVARSWSVHHRYNVEHWLDINLRGHPWRVTSLRDGLRRCLLA